MRVEIQDNVMLLFQINLCNKALKMNFLSLSQQFWTEFLLQPKLESNPRNYSKYTFFPGIYNEFGKVAAPKVNANISSGSQMFKRDREEVGNGMKV